MTLRHIRIFLAVCENGNNTTRAARALYLAQPAVSRAVAELEEYYGVRLFDRIGRRLYLTEAGRRMWEYAVHICGLFDDLEKGLRGWDEQGVLRVGASITIGSQFLPGYVDAFRAAHPGVDVRVWVGPSEQLEEKLLHNTLDVALMEGPVHGSALTAEEYMADTLDEDWGNARGMEIRSVSIQVSYDEESQKLINMRNKGAMLSDQAVQQGYVAANISEGLKDAGSNAGGAMAGFMGMGVGMNAGAGILGGYHQNNMAQQQMQQQQPQQPQQPQPVQQQSQPQAEGGWLCSCGTQCTGKFCPNCGSKKPENTKRFCTECGTEVPPTAKFCPNCGNKL